MSENLVYAGIDIGGTSIKYGLVDDKGKVLFKEQKPTLVEKGAEPLIHLVTNIAESLLYHAAEEEHTIRWLGVGTPGSVDSKTGRVISQSPNIAGWEGMEIGGILKQRLNLPVHVDNDVNMMSLAESRFGAAAGYNSVVCVAVGTGVGGGVIFNGQLWRGANHTAGEIGHMTIDYNGPLCRCGNKGCIEVFCSSAAIMARTSEHLKHGLTPIFQDVLDGSLSNLNVRKLFAAVKKGDEVALQVINETASYLGAGLASVVNLLNPEIVVIGGGVADGGGGFVEAVAAEIRRRAFKPAVSNLRVAKASLGNDAGFIGAAIVGDFKV
ncbi:MAG: ROK family protein [candidate division Zixibacteria bacterium]|nr:ROK family protein [candidate division Zixibacteria bacterium]